MDPTLLLNSLSIVPLAGMSAFCTNQLLALSVFLVAGAMALSAFSAMCGKPPKVFGTRLPPALLLCVAQLFFILVAVGSVRKERLKEHEHNTGSASREMRVFLLAGVLAVLVFVVWQQPDLGATTMTLATAACYSMAALWMGKNLETDTWLLLSVLCVAFLAGSAFFQDHATLWLWLRVASVVAIYKVLRDMGLVGNGAHA